MDLYSLLSTFVTGMLLCQAILLAFFRVPALPEWQSLRQAKAFTALACVVLGVAYGSSALMGWTVDEPVQLVWFVVASLQAVLFTFTCIVFVAPQTPIRRRLLWHLIPIAVLTALMVAAYVFSPNMEQCFLDIGVGCYVIQLALYTYRFISVYRANVHHLEEVYADDLALRLRWVMRLFVSALAVGVLAVAVILFADPRIDAAFGLVVAVYYTYITISFTNYMSRAAFVVKAASLPEEIAVEAVTANEETTAADDLGHVREAVDRWVATKRYLESDMSVEEIARQMGISRQALNDYFSTVLKTPFRSWRIELRIREAQRLIAADASIPTGELCSRCGYHDRSNFHKHFLKVTGQSLAEYRSSVQRG